MALNLAQRWMGSFNALGARGDGIAAAIAHAWAATDTGLPGFRQALESSAATVPRDRVASLLVGSVSLLFNKKGSPRCFWPECCWASRLLCLVCHGWLPNAGQATTAQRLAVLAGQVSSPTKNSLCDRLYAIQRCVYSKHSVSSLTGPKGQESTCATYDTSRSKTSGSTAVDLATVGMTTA